MSDTSSSEGRASARPGADPDRRHPVHLPPMELHNTAVIIFVTTCTARRRPILESTPAHRAVVAAWTMASTWLVGRYVIMPERIYLFCPPSTFDAPSLERWMRFWKSLVTRNMGESRGAVWQRHQWDRQLRSGESYGDKWEYVRNNPVRHGRVLDANDWLYQGELNELRW